MDCSETLFACFVSSVLHYFLDDSMGICIICCGYDSLFVLFGIVGLRRLVCA